MKILTSFKDVLRDIPQITREKLERVLCHEEYPTLESLQELWDELKVEVWYVDSSYPPEDSFLEMLQREPEFSEEIADLYILSLYIKDDYGGGTYLIYPKGFFQK